MSEYEDDAVYLQSRKEAVMILILWSVCISWTVSYCYVKGYTDHRPREGTITGYMPNMTGLDRDPETLETPYDLGIPDWVFWGVAVPWLVCIVVSTWFSFVFMTDSEMDDEYEEDQEVQA